MSLSLDVSNAKCSPGHQCPWTLLTSSVAQVSVSLLAGNSLLDSGAAQVSVSLLTGHSLLASGAAQVSISLLAGHTLWAPGAAQVRSLDAFNAKCSPGQCRRLAEHTLLASPVALLQPDLVFECSPGESRWMLLTPSVAQINVSLLAGHTLSFTCSPRSDFSGVLT